MNITNPTIWLVKFDVLSCYIHLHVNITKPKFSKWRPSHFVEVTDKEISEIKINSVPKNTKDLCKNTKTISIFAQVNITNPTSWLVKFDVLSCYIHLQANITKPKFSKWRPSHFVEVTDKEISEIKINSVPKNTKDLCKNTKTISIFAQVNITNPTSWLVKFDVLSCYIHLQANITKPKFSKWRPSHFVEVTDKEISEIKINSVPKNTKDLCKNTKTIIRRRRGDYRGIFTSTSSRRIFPDNHLAFGE